MSADIDYGKIDYGDITNIILVPTIKEIKHNLRVTLTYDLEKILANIKEQYSVYKTMYKKDLEDTMDGKLDRHKLASCLCGAVIKTQPFGNAIGDAELVACRYPNELLAFWCGLNLLKVFLIEDYSLDVIQRNYIVSQYPKLPDTTKDKRGYLACAVYSLADLRTKEPNYGYDFLGNSDRFFHIERYNIDIANDYISQLKRSS